MHGKIIMISFGQYWIVWMSDYQSKSWDDLLLIFIYTSVINYILTTEIFTNK